MSATVALCLKLNPYSHHFPNRPQLKTSVFAKYSHFVCFAFSSSNSCRSNDPLNYGPQEEARWLREEQRWLREEQRWLREESRWNAEKEALLGEIQVLKMRVQELERLNSMQGTSVSETVANIAKLLQVLKEGELGQTMNRIPEIGSGALPFVVETAKKEEEVVVKEIVEVPKKEDKQVKKRATLKMGSEGDEVRAMQEALQKLGFYSGEEDMEFSSFSSGTNRAVKTWQATVGAREDGIMTVELLERLYAEQKLGDPGLRVVKLPEEPVVIVPDKKTANGAAIASVTDVSEVRKTVVREGSMTEVEISEHRVYLLGENRWEEPSRLSGRSKQSGTKSSSSKSATKCLSCHGEGRLLCMECDGTGEPNIEPQFLEWIGENAECPYCNGHGYVTCDVCEGKKVTEA